MSVKQKRKVTREEFDELASEIRTITGGKLKGHKDGDSEQLLYKQ